MFLHRSAEHGTAGPTFLSQEGKTHHDNAMSPGHTHAQDRHRRNKFEDAIVATNNPSSHTSCQKSSRIFLSEVHPAINAKETPHKDFEATG